MKNDYCEIGYITSCKNFILFWTLQESVFVWHHSNISWLLQMKFLNSNVSLQVNADTQLMNDGIKIWWSTFFDQNALFWQLHDSSFIVNGYQLTLVQWILLSIQCTGRLWSDYFGV